MSTTDPLREALQGAREALHRACLIIGSTDGFAADFDAINAALAAVPVEPERNDERLAFLAGEGTLTVAQVQEWVVELSDSTFADLTDDTTPLMVSVVRPVEPEAWEWHVAGPQPALPSHDYRTEASDGRAIVGC